MIIIKYEEINNFMNEMQEDWSDLKKARYIFVKLCKMYNYNPKYAYAKEEDKGEFLRQEIASSNLMRDNKGDEVTDNVKEFLEGDKICVSLATIYTKLLKKANIEAEQLLGSVFINTENNKIVTNISDGILSGQSMIYPKGFGGMEDLEEIKAIDKELGFIEDEYNKPNPNEVLPKTGTVKEQVQKMLEYGTDYIEKVIGRKLKNVEFHQFYNMILKGRFPQKNVKVFPLHKKEFKDIKYAIMGKELESEEHFYFLYKDETGKFIEATEKDIKELKVKGYKKPER